ncbi:hypothetical protein OROGR_006528 [Orobanche gracilis]
MDLQKPNGTGDMTFIPPRGARQNSPQDGKARGTSRKLGHTKLCARGHWRLHEDAKLRELVAHFGPQNWNLIAEKLQGRSGKSCRLRWYNQLDPRINRRAFSEEEDERLLAARELYGNKWAMISRLFPGRTDNAVKNHYHVIMARRHRETNSSYRRSSRNPYYSFSLQQGFSGTAATDVGNACSGISTTTISNNNNNNNESVVSTCTELSLTTSSVRVARLLSRCCSRVPGHDGQHQQNLMDCESAGAAGENYTVTMERSEMKIQGNIINTRMCEKGPKCNYAENVDQKSDSNSEISAISESVAHNKSNISNYLYMCGENDKGVKMEFIDFLGVGAT